MGKKVSFAEFELDYGRFELYQDGRPLPLEGLPVQLLMLPIENPRQLVTREQIADQLWGKDVFVDVEQGINTAIRKIRMALHDDSGQPRYLRTVVGKGYRFVAEISVDQEPEGVLGEKQFMVSAEEFGAAIRAAAGLEPYRPEMPMQQRPRTGKQGRSQGSKAASVGGPSL